jgi:hypothetical protein
LIGLFLIVALVAIGAFWETLRTVGGAKPNPANHYNSIVPAAVETKARPPARRSNSTICLSSMSAHAVDSASADAAVSLTTDKARAGSAQRPVIGLKMWFDCPDLSN